MGRALVLNASYEPLGVVASRRAVVLVLASKADMVHDTGRCLRSQRAQVPVPSVIRLRYLVKVPYQRRVNLSRRAVLFRDGRRCQYCGRDADSIDHVVPRSRGGAHAWDNVVAACRRCNLAKGNHLLGEISMTLHRQPAAPKHLSWLAVTVERVPEQWKPYLGEKLLSRVTDGPEGPEVLERASRLDCAGVELLRLHRVAVPLRSPLRASHGTETVRHSTLVELRDVSGAAGWGECPALTHPTYTSEYAFGAWRVLCDELGPAALAGRGATIRGHAMARFALEAALADLRLRLVGRSLADALAGAACSVGEGGRGEAGETGGEGGNGRPAGLGMRRRTVGRTAVVGRRIDVESTRSSLGRDIDGLLAATADAASGGARLVKVKVEPGWDRAPLTALRAAFPGLPLAADANGAYAAAGADELDWVEGLDLAYFEQPLDPDDLVGHARLQARLATTPLALDESLGSIGQLAAAVAVGAARRFSLKPSRLGGLLGPAQAAAATPGCFVGGMFELGVGRAAAAALAALEAIELPSDLGPSSRYVEDDVTEPLGLDEHGDLIVPHGPGIGVDVRPQRVAALAAEVVELRP